MLDQLFLGALAQHGPEMSREQLFEAVPIQQIERSALDEWLKGALDKGWVMRSEGPGEISLWSLTPVGEAELR